MNRSRRPILPLIAILVLAATSRLLASPPDARPRGEDKNQPRIEPGHSTGASIRPGSAGEAVPIDEKHGTLSAVSAVLLGVMGILGVFAGLTLLALSIVGLKRVVLYIEDSSGARGAPQPVAQPVPDPKARVEAPSPTPETASKALPAQAAPTLQPWKLAVGAMASPETSAWIRPAFRAAFSGCPEPGPARVKVSGRDYTVEFVSIDGSAARVRVNGFEFSVDLGALPEGAGIETVRAGPAPAAWPQAALATPQAAAPGNAQVAPPKTAQPGSGQAPQGTTVVRAPIPGTVIEIKVRPGAAVTRGQEILVLEAMKMENRILSPADGIVRELKVSEKAAVRQGDALAIIGPA